MYATANPLDSVTQLARTAKVRADKGVPTGAVLGRDIQNGGARWHDGLVFSKLALAATIRL